VSDTLVYELQLLFQFALLEPFTLSCRFGKEKCTNARLDIIGFFEGRVGVY
jgi:hypothetical protein